MTRLLQSIFLFGWFVLLVHSLASTDTIRDADPAQAGYLPNHNMDPAVVDSKEFGQLWKMAFNSKEQFYAKPLVYTPPSTGTQIVFIASSQNWIRTLDAKDGTLLLTRQVETPFLQSDIGCTDIPNTIGITGTPVIDPNTDTAYFFVKTYIPNFRQPGDTGVPNGVYWFYAVDVLTLEDRPGFPVLIDGTQAQNDLRKYFVGGVILQRTALTQIGNVVYAGFGGHCDLFNYTGIIMGVDIVQKAVVTQFATEVGPLVPQTNDLLQNGGGGEGGVWMSGMGPATDGNRLFVVTGNGDGHQNNGVPATGRVLLQTLGEVAMNLAIDPETGNLSLTDYFQPYDYENMDAGDEDFGSGGFSLLDPTVFNGTGVARIGITCGKNGKIYILNADNLGGYRLGAGQTDGIIQTIETDLAVFGGGGSYPLEGGYFYFTPVGNPTFVYKLGHDDAGGPVFSLVGQSPENSAGRVGVGVPTVTSLNNQPGTGIIWMTDPDAGLRAWHAVPGPDGLLQTINLPQVNGLNKFQRPAFGDTRLYVTDSNGVIYCLGSPVALPLNCTSPVNFGSVALGSSLTVNINCTANIPITSVDGATTGGNFFEVSNSSLPQGSLAQGQKFSFPVTWDLTDAALGNTPNASFGNVSPGVKSTALTIFTTNGIDGFSTLFPISLTGVEVSENAFLSLSPVEVDFGGLVVMPNSSVPTSTSSFSISNIGLAPMTILGYAFTTDELDDDPTFTNVTATNGNSSGIFNLGFGFTSDNLPPVGSVIDSTDSVAVHATFTAVNGTGTYSSFFFVWTTGGVSDLLLSASASTGPIALIQVSNGEGGFLPPEDETMDFGNVAPGDSKTLEIQICNTGGSVLTIEKSKPPGQPELTATAPGVELHETQQIAVGTCATGSVIFQPAVEPPNAPPRTLNDTWTLNTDDLGSTIHVIEITGTVADRQIGPLLANGLARYEYLGCYQDGTDGRVLPQEQYSNTSNENALCQNVCLENNFIFAGTEFQEECWCGNDEPAQRFFQAESLDKCTFACPGDASQACGGDGTFISVYYDTQRFDPNGTNTAPTTTSSGPLPTVTSEVPGNVNFTLLGCFMEPTNTRALANLVVATDLMTVDLCLSSCSDMMFAGIEFARECWCGPTLTPGTMKQPDSSCSMTCSGNQTEFCGGPSLLTLYQHNNVSSSRLR